MSRHWFLTGASSGIGRHLAEIILASGDDLTATVRRPETLDDLAQVSGSELGQRRMGRALGGTASQGQGQSQSHGGRLEGQG